MIYQCQFEVHIYQVLLSKVSGKDEYPSLFCDSIFVRSTVKSSPKDQGENQLPLIGFTPGGHMMDTMSISTHSADLIFLSILSVNLDPYSSFLFPLILLTKKKNLQNSEGRQINYVLLWRSLPFLIMLTVLFCFPWMSLLCHSFFFFFATLNLITMSNKIIWNLQ